MLKWKVPSNRQTLGENSNYPFKQEGSIEQAEKRPISRRTVYNKTSIHEAKRRPRSLDILRSNEETSEFEDGSSCFGSDSSVCRDEIANLDDIILSFKSKTFLTDEEDSVITNKSSNPSSCFILDRESGVTRGKCEPLIDVTPELSRDSKKGYLADESDIVSSNEGTSNIKNPLFKPQESTEGGIMAEVFQRNKELAGATDREWDDVSLEATDEDDEDTRELMYYMASSVDETSSTSGISTGGSEWEWKSHRDILHTLKAFCSKCKREELPAKHSIQSHETSPNQARETETSVDEPPSKENLGEIFCPHAFKKKMSKANSENVLSDRSRTITKTQISEKFIKPSHSSRLSLPPTDNNPLKLDNLEDELFEDSFTEENKPMSGAESNKRSQLMDINFSYGLRLNKFTFLPKCDKISSKEEKQHKRKSHFFTDDFPNAESNSRSWLDDRPNRDICSPTVNDCKAKLNKLFRSRSFSFSKLELFSSFTNSDCNNKPPKEEPKPGELSEKKKAKGIPRISFPKGISKSLPKPKVMQSRPSVMDFFKPKLKAEDIEDGAYVSLFPVKDMSAIHLAAEGRDYLMWCPDAEFDRTVATLDMRGLIELIHSLQDAMAVEQQTFESLSQQLEQVEDPLLQQRMSAALCTSQTRLARLCSRNMRCFSQQALKSRQREQGSTSILDSRSSSPRDSGFAVSSSGSDFESDPRGMPSSPGSSSGVNGGHSFKNSLAFFQRAAHIVSSNSRSSNGGHRHREPKRTSKRSSSESLSKDSSSSSRGVNGKESQTRDGLDFRNCGLERRDSDTEDNETYEQVLYINGRPQFQEESSKRSRSFDPLLDSRVSRPDRCEGTSIAVTDESPSWRKTRSPASERSCSWTRVEIRSDSPPHSSETSVNAEPPYRSVGLANPAHSRSLGDVTTCVTLPRRKPVLNFGSVSGEVRDDSAPPGSVKRCQNIDSRDRITHDPLNSFSTITRAHSFKEGLDLTHDTAKGPSLTRAQSLYDGLDTDFGESTSTSKLSRAPSVEEILESVKFLRAKKSGMVKSSPDLLQISQEKSHSSSRVKSSSKSTSKSSKGSSTTSVPVVISSSDIKRVEKSRKSHDLERPHDADDHCYENIGSRGCQYENVSCIRRAEVIYDSPKSSKVVVVEKHHRNSKPSDDSPVITDHYESLDFDPVYENISDSEPTYMNVSSRRSGKDVPFHPTSDDHPVYANMEETELPIRSVSRKIKGGNTPLAYDVDQTYDVPKVATHIYDTPVKQTRKVRPQPTSKTKPNVGENTYDTPHNNRSVLPQSSQILLKAKTEQIRKIEDIFADCEKDSLDGDGEDAESSPDIPPPDYGSEEDDSSDKGTPKSDPSSAADYIDEGLGESDSRSYYADDQGLEVILEEPEDDYASSHSSAEDLRRRLDFRLRRKGERRSLGSLEGSEGIGSAEGEEEGDSHSSGCSEGGAEEDCGSSGIHSEGLTRDDGKEKLNDRRIQNASEIVDSGEDINNESNFVLNQENKSIKSANKIGWNVCENGHIAIDKIADEEILIMNKDEEEKSSITTNENGMNGETEKYYLVKGSNEELSKAKNDKKSSLKNKMCSDEDVLDDKYHSSQKSVPVTEVKEVFHISDTPIFLGKQIEKDNSLCSSRNLKPGSVKTTTDAFEDSFALFMDSEVNKIEEHMEVDLVPIRKAKEIAKVNERFQQLYEVEIHNESEGPPATSNATPVPPLRKKRAPSVPILNFHREDGNSASHTIKTSPSVLPPPRSKLKERRLQLTSSKNAKESLSKKESGSYFGYSMPDITKISDDEVEFLRDLENGCQYQTKVEDQNGMNDIKADPSSELNHHDVSFSSPEISDVLGGEPPGPHCLLHRASVCLMAEKSSPPASPHTTPIRKTPFLKRKSYTFTQGDSYMRDARSRIKIKTKTRSVGSIIRRTFSLKDVRNSENPPCMPNLFKRYRQNKKRKQMEKQRHLLNLPPINEEGNWQLERSPTAESFASIFMHDDENESYLEQCTENIDFNCSCASLHFPDQQSNLRRSNSSIDVSQYVNVSTSTLGKTVKKGSLPCIHRVLPTKRVLLRNLPNEISTASLNQEALKRAQELLNKSIGSKKEHCDNVCPMPPKRKSKSTLSLVLERSPQDLDLLNTSKDENVAPSTDEVSVEPVKVNSLTTRRGSATETFKSIFSSLGANNTSPKGTKGGDKIPQTIFNNESVFEETEKDISVKSETLPRKVFNKFSNDYNKMLAKKRARFMKRNSEPGFKLTDKARDICEKNPQEVVMQRFLRRYSYDMNSLEQIKDECQDTPDGSAKPCNIFKGMSLEEVQKIGSKVLMGTESVGNGYFRGTNMYRDVFRTQNESPVLGGSSPKQEESSFQQLSKEYEDELNYTVERLEKLDSLQSGEINTDSDLKGNCQVFNFPYNKELSSKSKQFTVDGETLIKECENGKLDLKFEKLTKMYTSEIPNSDNTEKSHFIDDQCLQEIAKQYEREILEHCNKLSSVSSNVNSEFDGPSKGSGKRTVPDKLDKRITFITSQSFKTGNDCDVLAVLFGEEILSGALKEMSSNRSQRSQSCKKDIEILAEDYEKYILPYSLKLSEEMSRQVESVCKERYKPIDKCENAIITKHQGTIFSQKDYPRSLYISDDLLDKRAENYEKIIDMQHQHLLKMLSPNKEFKQHDKYQKDSSRLPNLKQRLSQNDNNIATLAKQYEDEISAHILQMSKERKNIPAVACRNAATNTFSPRIKVFPKSLFIPDVLLEKRAEEYEKLISRYSNMLQAQHSPEILSPNKEFEQHDKNQGESSRLSNLKQRPLRDDSYIITLAKQYEDEISSHILQMSNEKKNILAVACRIAVANTLSPQNRDFPRSLFISDVLLEKRAEEYEKLISRLQSSSLSDFQKQSFQNDKNIEILTKEFEDEILSQVQQMSKERKFAAEVENTLSHIRGRLKNVYKLSYINMKINAHGLIESNKSLESSSSLPEERLVAANESIIETKNKAPIKSNVRKRLVNQFSMDDTRQKICNLLSETHSQPESKPDLELKSTSNSKLVRRSLSENVPIPKLDLKLKSLSNPLLVPKLVIESAPEIIPQTELKHPTQSKALREIAHEGKSNFSIVSQPKNSKLESKSVPVSAFSLNSSSADYSKSNQQHSEIKILVNEQKIYPELTSARSFDSMEDYQEFNNAFSDSLRFFRFQPLSLSKLSANIYFKDKKMEMFSKNMDTAQAVNKFILSENYNNPSNMVFSDAKEKHLDDVMNTKISTGATSSLQHWYLANQKPSVRNTVVPNLSPLPEEAFKNEYQKLRASNNYQINTTERAKSPIMQRSKDVFHFPYSCTLSDIAKGVENGLQPDSSNKTSPPLLSPESSLDEPGGIVVKKVVPSPLTSRKFFICSVPNEYSTGAGSENEEKRARNDIDENDLKINHSTETSTRESSTENLNGLSQPQFTKYKEESSILVCQATAPPDVNVVPPPKQMNGDSNTIKDKCLLKCDCRDEVEMCETDSVKILAVQKKTEQSPEIVLRTWSERQDNSESRQSPSPVMIPKWVKETKSRSQSFRKDSSRDTSSPGPLSEPALPGSESSTKKEEDRTQKDRCVEVYPETIRQRQRNMAPSPSKVDIKNWEPSAVANEDGKKFLPSVKALRNQFENGKPNSNSLVRTASNSSSTNSLVLSSLDTSSGFGSLTSSQATFELASTTTPPVREMDTAEEERVEPIFSQFKEVDEELKQMMSKPPSTQGWNPHSLLKRLYYIPDAPKIHRREAPFVNIEGYLEKLPSGRKKATFWNAWKRRYFVAKDGILYYYQNNQTEKPNMKLCLMGGKIEIMDANMVTVDDGGRESRNAGMLGIDDGKGHYVVVRCTSRQEAERWKTALETHTIDDFSSQYVQPWPRPTNPTLLRDTLVIDIGSCSVRAGVLASQPTLPQLFFPSVVATNRETRNQIWGTEALMPDVRSVSTISFPVRPSHKISKFSVDLNAVSSLLQKTFNDLKVDPKNYNIQLSVPRVLNPHTQAELLKVLFDKFEVKSVNMTHQSILALYAYNATSGVIVDIGERLDVVPVIDGYIVDGGVSRVPYGGYRIMDHLRQFLFQKNISLINDVDSYVIRQVLETICYCAQHYNTEKQRCSMNPENFEKSAPLADFFPDSPQYEMFRDISLEFARFQATEGLFNPDAWGLDHPGLHKLVHKAIQECSMDIRKEMSRSIFLAGGVTQLPGIADRLTVELDNLTPPAIRPKVHSSPYRYHAAYLGACELAESPAFSQSKITKEEWTKQGNSSLRKWAL